MRGPSLIATPTIAAALALATPMLVCAQPRSPTAPAGSPPLTFQEVLDLALAQNLELSAVRRARTIKDAEVRVAGQWANPEFFGEITRDTPHGDLTIGLPVDISGRRTKRVAVAKAELAMADVDEANAMRQVRRDARLSFYGALIAQQQVVLAENVVEIAQRFRDVAQARFEEGAAPRLEVMAAHLGLVRSKADLDLARWSLQAAQADLNALLNRPPGMELTLAGETFEPPALPTLDRVTATALAANVDLAALDRQAAVETSTFSLLKAERVPMPIVSFGTALNAPGEFDVGPHAGVSLELPLFSRNQGGLAASEARSGTIAARQAALRRRVEAQVYAAFKRVTAQRQQVEAFRDSLVPTATELQGLAEESYRLGRSSILAALEAQRSLRDVRYDYLQAVMAFQEAVAGLEDILGGPIK